MWSGPGSSTGCAAARLSPAPRAHHPLSHARTIRRAVQLSAGPPVGGATRRPPSPTLLPPCRPPEHPCAHGAPACPPAIAQVMKERAAHVQQMKMQQRMLHEERLQQETQERMLREEDRREHADKLVTQMEEQEEIAIERLRRAQDAQKAAYEELERALTNPPPPIDQRDVALGGGGMRKR